MTDYSRKYDAALTELNQTDMWPSNFAPPMLKVQKRLGFSARPPHYASFFSTMIGYAIWFGAVWGVLMWFISWRGQDFTIVAAAGAASLAGVVFGIVMATYYARGRRKYGLSRWEDL
ncbi:MAG: DUF6404 family protein [Sulfitobacter sp.]